MKMTLRIILIGGLIIFLGAVAMVVFMPAMMETSPTTIAHPYDELQAAGRKLYYSNGCNYCHTQYVREQDTAMGPVAVRGNYAFDQPALFGSERTGPDLSHVGRKRSEAWQIAHLKDPRALSPLSIMPSFEFLSDGELAALTAYLFAMGDRVAQPRMIPVPAPFEGAAEPKPIPTVSLDEGSAPRGWATWRKAGLQEGKELYTSLCLTCHGCAGNGLGTYAGTMAVTPADFSQEPQSGMPSEEWFWHVSEGLPGTLMPTWKASLPDSERWNVIRYVRLILARPIMRDPDEGDPPAGYAGLTDPVASTHEVLEQAKAIYTRECMVCHDAAGRGQGPHAARLEPPPPDFGDGSYGTLASPAFDDADYFWRVSEGIPWSAMPPWKVLYSDSDRWALVHYIRALLTGTEAMPSGEAPAFQFPETYKSQDMPGDADYERGRRSYALYCAQCHGLAGDGAGWSAQHLDPPPADFREMAGEKLGPALAAEHLAMVTFGLPGSSMPPWGEFLPERERWDVIRYLEDAFMTGRPTPAAAPGRLLSAEFSTASEEEWLAGGRTISAERGGSLYGTYCAACHGARGEGNGPGTLRNASGSPPALAPGIRLNYALWRISSGVPATTMYAFDALLDESALWDLAAHVTGLASAAGGSRKGRG